MTELITLLNKVSEGTSSLLTISHSPEDNQKLSEGLNTALL